MDNIFNEKEKKSIATVIYRLIAADRKYEKKELQYMHQLYLNYDIPLVSSDTDRLSYEEAVECIKQMTKEKISLVKKILSELSESDNDFDEREYSEIESVLTK